MRQRRFLNKPGFNSVAAIYAEVTVDKRDRSINTELIISDCGRSVKLSVGVYNREERVNTMFKVDTLIYVLTKFRDALERTDKRTGS